GLGRAREAHGGSENHACQSTYGHDSISVHRVSDMRILTEKSRAQCLINVNAVASPGQDLLSWQKYDASSSPPIQRSSQLLVQGCVYAPGSLTSTSYTSVSRSGREKRSISRSWSVCGKPPFVNQKSSLKTAVSTTSVSPSQRPTDRP